MRLILGLVLVFAASCANGQQGTSDPAKQEQSGPTQTAPSPAGTQTPAPAKDASDKPIVPPPPSKQQPKRILGVMPNFRAVSAGEVPQPPTPKQAFVIATKNSFDYSSFAFVGVTSAIAEWTNAHPELGQGMPGFGRYYWRGFVDKTDGNYWVIFLLPTAFHHDNRYFALGDGTFTKRLAYASSRIFIERDYEGHSVFNVSEVFGRAAAQAISITYYPPKSHTGGALAKKYAFALGRDALTNAFREFWPDIATKVLHRQP